MDIGTLGLEQWVSFLSKNYSKKEFDPVWATDIIIISKVSFGTVTRRKGYWIELSSKY